MASRGEAGKHGQDGARFGAIEDGRAETQRTVDIKSSAIFVTILPAQRAASVDRPIPPPNRTTPSGGLLPCRTPPPLRNALAPQAHDSKLDELMALLQRMLALPVNRLADETLDAAFRAGADEDNSID